MCLIKDGPFSLIRLFCHKYIETKRKSAKSDCVINSYTVDSGYLEFDGTMEKIRVNRSSTQKEL